MKTHSWLVGPGVLLFLLACGPSEAPSGNPLSQDPESLFRAFEEKLAAAKVARLDFSVSAEGAVEAKLHGRLQKSADGTIELNAVGDFSGEAVDLFLKADHERYEFGRGVTRTDGTTPKFLWEALSVGFTRMGVLHNLAMLAGNSPPDRADGGVREWVEVNSFAFGEPGAEDAGATVIAFSLIVAGEGVGSAMVELGTDGHPKVRRQVVQFPTGEMRVVEEYISVVMDAGGLEAK